MGRITKIDREGKYYTPMAAAGRERKRLPSDTQAVEMHWCQASHVQLRETVIRQHRQVAEKADEDVTGNVGFGKSR